MDLDFLKKYISEILELSSDEGQYLNEVIHEKYSETHRYYHNLTHIYDLTLLFLQFQPFIKNKQVVYLSILFHDIIYNPTSKTNEEDSAVFAYEVCTRCPALACLQSQVEMYILTTKSHSISIDNNDDEDLKLFLDMDMSILGTERLKYAQYAKNVRKEYIHIEHSIYCKERAKFLRVFANTNIFASILFRDLYENNAKLNLEWECSILESGRLIHTSDYESQVPVHVTLNPFAKEIYRDINMHCALSRSENIIRAKFHLEGNMTQLLLGTPTIINPKERRRKHKLWEQTCFELFLNIPGSSRYWEVNVSPQGDWNVYRFDEYRSGYHIEEQITDIGYEIMTSNENHFKNLITIDLSSFIPADDLVDRVQLSATAVVQCADRSLGYFAHKHCGVTEPDFHIQESFSILL